MNLSRHFTLAELMRSDTAAREGIDNRPGAAEIESLKALCGAVLDPLRDAVGKPIKVNSGYRGAALNKRIGGSATSQHSHGKAADFQSPGTAVLDLFKQVIRMGLPFDQIIYEAQNANTKWVHVSHNPGANRGEIRIAQFGANGRPTGYPRITAEQALQMTERVSRSARGAAEPAYIETADEPPQEAPHDEPHVSQSLPANGAGRSTRAGKGARSAAPAASARAARSAGPEASAASPRSSRSARTASGTAARPASRPFVGAAEPLSTQGFAQALDLLGVGVAELMALVSVESKSCGFLPDRRPVILFERHWFHKLTRGQFSATHPDISQKSAGGYAGLGREYPRLEAAMALDREAALKSASWGAGQVMGFNHKIAGYDDVESMVSAMQASEDQHLLAVAGFLKTNDLATPMRNHDWAKVARVYNGSHYAKNKYDLRLAGAYQQFSSGTLPDIEVRRAQLYLTYLGYTPGAVDGVHGKFSRSAVVKFREDHAMPGGERVDKGLLEALGARVQSQ
jgi:hypothetical protein